LAEDDERDPSGGDLYEDCVENIFIATDTTDAETELASETWYAGNEYYTVADGEVNDGNVATDSDEVKAANRRSGKAFMRMIW
jgi:hypothetical protein